MADTNFNTLLFSKLIDLMFVEKAILVPKEFHAQCDRIETIIENDVTGLIGTILNFAINSASESSYRIEIDKNDALEKALNSWLAEINQSLRGKIPTGLKELSKEYYKERWTGSSLCLLRAADWQEREFNGNTILLPNALWFVNGSSIYIGSNNEQNLKLGSYEYYLDSGHKYSIPQNGEEIIVQKPFDRWFAKYPIPYLIRNGVYKNYKGLSLLQDKGDEVITKILPYLFLLKKGTENLALKGTEYDDNDMKQLQENFNGAVEKYKTQKGQIPTWATPFDLDVEHIIPDLRNILTEELFRQGYRAILSGLGFVDVIQGVSSTRKESVLNPKPFIAEVNSGISDFKSILMDLIGIIIEKNKEAHRKLLTSDQSIKIVSSEIKINTESILEIIRSAYDRGVISIQTMQEIVGVDPQVEKERREREAKEGLDDIFYPHLIQNREDIPDGSNVVPAKPKKDNLEDQNKKKGTPEVKNFNQAKIEETANYLRYRIKDPDLFEDNSFKTIIISEEKGIKAVVAKLKGEKKTSIQTYLFDKTKWTEEEVNKWIDEHSKASEEFLEIAPYNKLSELPESVKKLSQDLQDLWMRVFNETYKRSNGDEEKSFRVSWSVVNKQKKSKAKIEKSIEIDKTVDDLLKMQKIEIAKKQEKLLDLFLKEKEDKNENISG